MLEPGDEPQTYELGDVDGNGIVELKDAQLALRAALGIDRLSEEAAVAADVDKNNQVNLADAQLILRKALGIAVDF